MEPPVHPGPMQSLVDRLDDLFGVHKDIGIPEAQHPEARRPEEGVAARIVGRSLNMLRTVQFDDDATIDAGKVTDIEADLVLPAKLETRDLSPAHPAPQAPLGVGHVSPKVANVLEHAASGARGSGANVAETQP